MINKNLYRKFYFETQLSSFIKNSYTWDKFKNKRNKFLSQNEEDFV